MPSHDGQDGQSGEAEPGLTAEGGLEPSAGGQIAQVLRAFEQTTGLHVCVKLMQLAPSLPEGRADGSSFPGAHETFTCRPPEVERALASFDMHRSDFCMAVKQRHNERCKQCDLRDVPVRCLEVKTVFAHTCHAGAKEIILPLLLDGQMVGVAYLGQYRTDHQSHPRLPYIDQAQQQRLVHLSQALSGYLVQLLRTPRFLSENSRGSRREAIYGYLARNLHANPSLDDLAEHLGLSVTRTAHAVRESTGLSFVQIKDQLRLHRAEQLLRETYHKVAQVGVLCGFESSQYFHRFFRRQRGMTPLSYRRKFRVEV